MDTSLPVTIAGLEFSKVGRDALGRKVFGVTLYGHRVAQAVADIPFGVYTLTAPPDSILRRYHGLVLGTRKGMGYDILVAAIQERPHL